jgi:hypothetical protein
MRANCIQDCFDSTSGRYYARGESYEVDASSSFIQAHFDVPKGEKEAEPPKPPKPPKGQKGKKAPAAGNTSSAPAGQDEDPDDKEGGDED